MAPFAYQASPAAPTGATHKLLSRRYQVRRRKCPRRRHLPGMESGVESPAASLPDLVALTQPSLLLQPRLEGVRRVLQPCQSANWFPVSIIFIIAVSQIGGSSAPILPSSASAHFAYTATCSSNIDATTTDLSTHTQHEGARQD